MNIVGKRLPHAVRARHAGDTRLLKGIMEDLPGRFPPQPSSAVLLAGEQVPVRAGRQPSRLNPSRHCLRRVMVEHDGSSRMFPLSVLARDVKPPHGPFPIPYLTHFQGEQFTDPKTSADAQGNEGSITESIAPLQVGQREFEFLRG
ncbi:MAG TPA: hypothetical protein VL981_05310 [Candidatus Methylacidiphilales bacterium]|nr:hypothetical protein [Candidatus Methylacidiphilales bacterium]